MTKTTIAVTIETEVVEHARERGINISEAAEQGIRSALNEGPAEKEDRIQNVLNSLTEAQRKTILDVYERKGTLPIGWIRVIKESTGIRITTHDLEIMVEKLKGAKS